MQLERLRKLNEAIAKLDAGIKEEKREQKQSVDLSKLAKVDPKDLTDPQKQQQQNRKATEGGCGDREKHLGACCCRRRVRDWAGRARAWRRWRRGIWAVGGRVMRAGTATRGRGQHAEGARSTGSRAAEDFG